jgi:hypothetical protein
MAISKGCASAQAWMIRTRAVINASSRRGAIHFSQPPIQSGAGAHHDRHRHPQHLPLALDAQFIRLDMLQVSWLLHQVGMYLLAVSPHTPLPGHHGALIQAKDDHNRPQGTSIRKQRRHQHH